LWGLLPLYWHYLHAASAFEILAHRGIWSLVVCVILLSLKKQLRIVFSIVKERRKFALLALTSALLTMNWATYIWAVSVNRVVEASLGYYITPLVNVALGVFIFREKLRKFQWAAVTLAALGVLGLTIEYGSLPWIAIALAFSWGLYTFMKKSLQLGALETLTIETLVALLPCLTYLLLLEHDGRAQFGQSFWFSIALASAGFITVVPLLLFNGAATRLPLTITGLLQYITPTIMFLIGILVNHEAMSIGRLVGFSAIWVALIFLAADLLQANRSTNKN
jgi:chloramphenicol-sensitive protein RarD